MHRNVANLFKGRKPKALCGNAGKLERKQYKDRASASKKKKPGLVETHKTILPMHWVQDEAVKSRLLTDYLLQRFCTPQTRMLFKRFQIYSRAPTSQILAQIISRKPGKRKKLLTALLEQIEKARTDLRKALPKVRRLVYSAPKLNAKISKTIPRRYQDMPLEHDLASSTEDILGNQYIDAVILLKEFEQEVKKQLTQS